MRTPRALLLVGLLALGAHATSLAGGFVFDDRPAVLENPVVQRPLEIGRLMARDFWGRAPGPDSIGTWRPVALLSLWVDWRAGGGSPGAFHATNVILHVLASLALAAALLVQTGRPRLALGSGLAFAGLAVCSEAVASIVGRADMMGAALGFAAWAAAGPPEAAAGSPEAAAGAGRAARAFASGVLLLLALLCKESAIVFPVIVLAADRALASRPPRLLSLRYVALGLAVLVAIALRLHFFGDPRQVFRAASNNPLLDEPLGVRLLTAPRLLLLALRLMLLPIELSADYSFAEILPQRALLSFEVLAGLAAVGLLAVLVVRGRRSDPVLALAAAILLLGWLPSSNALFPLPVIFAERLLYLPAAGVAVGLARLLEMLRERGRNAAALALVLLLAANPVRAAFADRAWHDDLTLFAQAVRVSERSARAWLNYGAALDRAGRIDEAMAAVERGLQIAPAWAALHAEAGVLLEKSGRPDAALAALERAVSLDPRDARSAYNLALFLARRGERSSALTVASRFLAENPGRLSADAPLARLAADLARGPGGTPGDPGHHEGR